MPWVRSGDNALRYPKLTQIRSFPGADRSSRLLVFGFFMGCAQESAAWTTDYVVSFATAEDVAGDTAVCRRLIRWCVRAGLMTPTKVKGMEHWILHNDPAFVHIRTKAELDAERNNASDRRNFDLIVPVRLRDGDNCRWCGKQVMWTGAKSNRSGQYDHLAPGEPATVDTFVVACTTCNTARQENPDWGKLRPPPITPTYSPMTAGLLTKNGHPTEPNTEPDVARRRSTESAAATPAATTAARAARPDARTRTATASTTAQPNEPPDNRDTSPFRTGSVGSGRDGSGSGSPRKRGARGKRRTRPEDPPPPAATPCCAVPYPSPDLSVCLTCGRETP